MIICFVILLLPDLTRVPETIGDDDDDDDEDDDALAAAGSSFSTRCHRSNSSAVSGEFDTMLTVNAFCAAPIRISRRRRVARGCPPGPTSW